jgi:putative ABC transport system ATP-binding protein
MSVIELQDVTRVYTIGEVETRALRGVNLTIQAGEFTAIVGPSGSGKTTMLQLMGCLDRPTGGKVHINGQDVTQLNPNKRADLRKGTKEGKAARARERVVGGGGTLGPRPSPS